ncbi:PRK1 [Candida margitis]|uniref:PRK1 n=1 Tax=Candida margitis TaxID=1775924 RepID=UPI0022272546|nr:PRK1 [Candida margitis]KAI5967640.1 PRK1 [Candida margitis]
MPPPSPPPDAYKPGTKLVVGSHQISIIKYISAGGFAHVYTCHIDPAFHGSNTACLKRVVVPSKWQLSLLRQEVDAMRRLRGNKHIVSYIDSHASRLNEPNHHNQQQYEVLLLMEYCENNGLIDFMNTRLVNKLTEKEIIDIMYQVTIGVAMCHHLRPPLIHRDIKIENVLIDSNHVFKLCDFGSSVNYMAPPKNPQELQLMKDDLMQHTTPQYRAPEMIDLTKGFPVDDKSDIWALGIFLYKLCYYTTPFESPNQSNLQDLERAILNCSETLRFKDQPGSMFSPRLKNVIKVCLRADPRRRPNAVQLLGELCQMKGQTKVPNVIPASILQAATTDIKKSVSPSAPEAKRSVSPPAPETKKLVTPPLHHNNAKAKAGKSVDAFAAIDKTKFMKKLDTKAVSSPFESEPKRAVTRPLSAYYDNGHKPKIYAQGNKSTPSVQDKVKQELARGYETTDLGETEDTMKFLKTKESESHDGSMKSAWNSLRRISTGGSNTLRRISTGGSISANNTGASDYGSRRKSLKQILTGSRRSSDEKIDPVTSDESVEKEKSIQKRMQALLAQSESQQVHKTASGYGRFTDKNVVDDIDSINESPYTKKPPVKKLAPPKVPVNLSSSRQHKSPTPDAAKPQVSSNKHSHRPKSYVAPTPSPKPAYKPKPKPKPKPQVHHDNPKKPPPSKPKKPSFLKSDQQPSRRSSTGSDLSLPDIDDLEKQFSKRFPNYV